MPQALIATAPRVAELRTYRDRSLARNEILVEVDFASPKHGTELVDFRGLNPFDREKYDPEWRAFMARDKDETPAVVFGEWNPGNMWVGRVVELGADVSAFSIGDRVCSYGGIRETQIVRAVDNFRLRKVPEGVSPKAAVCYDPAQFALGGVRDALLRPGDAACVFGLGAIGLLAVQMIRAIGTGTLVVVDPITRRRELALEYGADLALDPSDPATDVGLELKRATDKRGVDAVVETSGHGSALQAALRGLAYGGRISYVAFSKVIDDLRLGREAHFNAAELVFSRAASEPNRDHPRWDRKRIEDACWDMLVRGRLDCERIVDPVVPFAVSAEGFMRYVDRSPELAVKLGVEFGRSVP
ncbi:MAG: zinc-binding dehydrogenase [Spirochaetales bacterium]|nr:zinc-binding dehydrogenase [Spirochaetales bacterium]